MLFGFTHELTGRWLWGLLALAVGLAVLAISLWPRPRAATDQVTPPAVRFTDITQAAGIRFRHVSGATPDKLLPETMSGGVAFLDYNNDGRPDLLFVNSRPWPDTAAGPLPTLALYRNDGGRFTDVTAELGLDVALYGMGATAGDYDNDGWTDVLVTGVGGNRLFRNDGGRRFVDATGPAGLGGLPGLPAGSRTDFLRHDRPIPFGSSATFVDYDGDGLLDLFVCYYLSWSPAQDLAVPATLPGVGRAYVPPSELPGTQCVLYRNVGGRRFQDVSAEAGVQVTEAAGTGAVRPVAKALGVVACDPDGDGWPDLVVANDTERNFFFHNQPGPGGTRRFEEKGVRCGAAYAEARPRGGMGVDWGEVLPGRSALVIANFADEPNTLLEQSNPPHLLFSDRAAAAGLADPSRALLKFGAFFFDYDLDGRLDLLTCNGHLEPDIARSRPLESHAQPAQLFWNSGRWPRLFVPVPAEQVGPDLLRPLVGRGCAFADIDGDGDLDVVLAANNGPPLLLRNDNPPGRHWLRLTLQGDGRRSNRSAIGAVVEVESGDRVQRRQVTAGRGYLSQSELTLTFGLGNRDKVDRVTIQWPGAAGGTQVLEGLAVDQEHAVRQQGGAVGTGRRGDSRPSGGVWLAIAAGK